MDLFEVEFDKVFTEEQFKILNKLPSDTKNTLEKFIRDIQIKHENVKKDSLTKIDQLGEYIL